jgi:hypothetical protein
LGFGAAGWLLGVEYIPHQYPEHHSALLPQLFQKARPIFKVVNKRQSNANTLKKGKVS